MSRKKKEAVVLEESLAPLADAVPTASREVCCGCNTIVGLEETVQLKDGRLPRMLCLHCTHITEIGTGMEHKEANLNLGDVLASTKFLK